MKMLIQKKEVIIFSSIYPVFMVLKGLRTPAFSIYIYNIVMKIIRNVFRCSQGRQKAQNTFPPVLSTNQAVGESDDGHSKQIEMKV
jgi:hypothetical protein